MSTLLHLKAAKPLEHGRDPRTGVIVESAIEVHRHLGPGLLESAYEECLCHELHVRGVEFRRQVSVPVLYKGMPLDCGYQIDLIVQDEVVVELKAIEKVLPVHQAQLLTYMKLTGKVVGLLINFNVPVLTKESSDGCYEWHFEPVARSKSQEGFPCVSVSLW